MNRVFCVVLFDVVKSSAAEDREELVRRIQSAVASCNQRYGDSLFAPLEITRGDEVAGVLSTFSPLYRIVRDFVLSLQPYTARVAIAFDEVVAGLETRKSSVMDGPAFYKADALMTSIKGTQRLVALSLGDDLFDLSLEALMNAALWRWFELTRLQRRMLQLYLDGKTQTEIAATLGRRQQQVSRALRAARWEVVQLCERAVEKILTRLDQGVLENVGTRKDDLPV